MKGRIVVHRPEAVVEDVEKKKLIFRCKNVTCEKIENPPVREIFPPITKWMDEVTMNSGDLQFENVNFRFTDVDTAYTE